MRNLQLPSNEFSKIADNKVIMKEMNLDKDNRWDSTEQLFQRI